VPVPAEQVDPALVYDPDRQITLLRGSGELTPWCKHSTGQTRTNSNTDGQNAPETDTDHTED
jgi:putative ATP-grasp target RiPP